MPESGTQLIADLLYVAPQLAMHNLVTYQVDGRGGGCISHSFFAFGNVGNVVRKTWTYLVRTCHTTNDVVCHHVANRFVPFRLSGGHLSSVIWLLDCRPTRGSSKGGARRGVRQLSLIVHSTPGGSWGNWGTCESVTCIRQLAICKIKSKYRNAIRFICVPIKT